MKEQNLKPIVKIFEGNEIRSVWSSEEEKYYISVVDVVKALTASDRPRKYWSDLKRQLREEGTELSEKIGQLKLKASDGKYYITDVVDIENMFRIIESIPSKNAEPIKQWLAHLGSERIDEIFDPELAINRAITYYSNQGYDDEWIRMRLNGILNRKSLTDVWQDGGIKEKSEYAILTNEIYKTWSGMSASDYKKFKGLKKESLRDNMIDIEIALTDLGELTTRDIARKERPIGLKANAIVARKGGGSSKLAREYYENHTNKKAISKHRKKYSKRKYRNIGQRTSFI